MNKAIDILKNAGFAVKPGALLPFISIPHPGQMFRWDGAASDESKQITEAVSTLQAAGFVVEFVDTSNTIIHALAPV